MKFIFHPEAEDEFFDAIEYYEAVDVGLGYDFSMEVLATVRNITEYPLAWPILIEDVRRCLTNRLPIRRDIQYRRGSHSRAGSHALAA